MAKKGEQRAIVQLTCSECKEKNYTTIKNKRNDSQRLELKKYCSRCGKHTDHREAR